MTISAKNRNTPQFITYHGKTLAEQEAQSASLRKRGWRMVFLNVSGNLSEPRFTAVWVRNSGTSFKIFLNKTPSKCQQLLKAWKKRGYHPTIISAVGQDSRAKFSILLEKDSLAFHVEHGLSEEKFRQKCEEGKQNGNILRWCDVYGS